MTEELHNYIMHPNTIDITGQRFGRLSVIGITSLRSNTSTLWRCVCDCGKECLVASYSLRRAGQRKGTKSCGCLGTDATRKRSIKHEGSSTRIYRVWCGMKQRCLNPKDKHYAKYGGRGILIVKEWLNFETFRSWAMSSGYHDKAIIDRIDFNGNYSPENCRFVDHKESSRNRRTVIQVRLGDELVSASEAARRFGLHEDTLRLRLKRGWRLQDALNTPASKANRAPSYL